MNGDMLKLNNGSYQKEHLFPIPLPDLDPPLRVFSSCGCKRSGMGPSRYTGEKEVLPRESSIAASLAEFSMHTIDTTVSAGGGFSKDWAVTFGTKKM